VDFCATPPHGSDVRRRERTKQSKQKRLVFEVSLLPILLRLQGFRVRTASVPGMRINSDVPGGVWKPHYP
jgi:hypothetical protein